MLDIQNLRDLRKIKGCGVGLLSTSTKILESAEASSNLKFFLKPILEKVKKK